MSTKFSSKSLTFLVSFILAFCTFQASSEDIDIFSVDVDNTANNPNVLIVLDNSANWSRQSQQWPGGLQQGQSEARAIKNVISQLSHGINVGLFEHRTDGNANTNNNGFVRYHVRPMNSSNKSQLSGRLDQIFNNINSPTEKRSQGNSFGHLFHDVYNYLAGLNSNDPGSEGAGTPASIAHSDGYAPGHLYDQFRSPLTSTDTCTRTVIIFIGNNVQAGPTDDDTSNRTALQNLGGDIGPEPFPNYTVNTTTKTAIQGTSQACYSSKSACTTAENTLCTSADAGLLSCSCVDDTDNASYSAPVSCSAEKKYEIFGKPVTQSTGPTTTDPAEPNTSTGDATKCQNNSPNPYSCPAQSTVTEDGPGAGETTEVMTSWSSCAYVDNGNTCGKNNNKTLWEPEGTRTVSRTITTTTLGAEATFNTFTSCVDSAANCDTSAISNCTDGSYSCYCKESNFEDPGTANCPASNFAYDVLGTYEETTAVQVPGFTASPPLLMVDEWAAFMSKVGIPLPGTNPPVHTHVTTYTIDVFNAQQHPDFSSLLFNMADITGGKYYQAKNESQIEAALQEIFTEVQAVNTAFSSASLPVNATNRTQNENQVFIGLFRPDRTKRPSWFGNLKRYQLIKSGSTIRLGDKDGSPAINDITGFLSDCAVSYWTTPSGDYWLGVNTDDPPAIGTCGTAAGAEHSDAPDGPFVEKGAAAEVLRKGNNPSTSPDGDGNYPLVRNVKTESGGSLTSFVTPISGLADSTVNYIRGADVFDDDGDTGTTRATTEPRSTIHGDVIHSRPQPINYGGSTGVVIYYGANDGTFRAVKAEDGTELWSFVAPEHYSKLDRLRDNTPNIKFFGDSAPAIPKDYFFDGSTGVYQNADNSDIRIFPSMRRGGRMQYAFDVTNPTNPSLMWKKGCPNLDNDTGCTTGMSDIGQTWSLPRAALIKGYSTSNPVVVFGGGYDACEDQNTATPTCTNAKGSGVFVLDATNGSVIKHFDFNNRSVAADISLVDVNQDGMVDYGYAADTGGNIYRLDFVDSVTKGPLSSASWAWHRIAYTNGATTGLDAPRKFLFRPALLQVSPDLMYVAIGSGDRTHPLITQYPYSDVTNRFYVFKDTLSDTNPGTVINLDYSDPNDPNSMQDLTDPANATCSDPGVLPTSSAPGWFINLTAQGQGEQVVSSAVIISGSVIFSTNRPTLPSNTACTNSLGEARGYAMNLFNASGVIDSATGICDGDRSSEFVGGGLPPSPVVSTVPIDGELHTVILGAPQLDGDVSTALDAQEVDPPVESGRRPVFWYRKIDSD